MRATGKRFEWPRSVAERRPHMAETVARSHGFAVPLSSS